MELITLSGKIVQIEQWLKNMRICSIIWACNVDYVKRAHRPTEKRILSIRFESRNCHKLAGSHEFFDINSQNVKDINSLFTAPLERLQPLIVKLWETEWKKGMTVKIPKLDTCLNAVIGWVFRDSN